MKTRKHKAVPQKQIRELQLRAEKLCRRLADDDFTTPDFWGEFYEIAFLAADYKEQKNDRKFEQNAFVAATSRASFR